MKSELFREMIRPVLVLTVICIAAAALLGAVNAWTDPIITENARVKAEATRKEVLPGAGSFTEVQCDRQALDITGAYKEDGGLGYVITSSHKGYGGQVVVTVGISPEGAIVGLSADVSTETSGIGSKAGREDYIARFLGLSGNCNAVDTITNATYSSTAVKNGVNAALAAFKAITGGGSGQ
ncbi:MAG: FMN-binding protein [Lachnospiraceae bacterium]|nr:FMN-binding protein [Lachnospiraceae bacterium]